MRLRAPAAPESQPHKTPPEHHLSAGPLAPAPPRLPSLQRWSGKPASNCIRSPDRVLPNSAWVHKHFDCETLFGKAPFEVLQFNLSQLGFEQALIPFNILVMCAQAGSSSIHDEIPPLNAFFKLELIKLEPMATRGGRDSA